MENKNQVSKNRTISSTSSNSSVTEYVNEMYEESELELSKVVSIQVSKEDDSIKCSSGGTSFDVEKKNEGSKKLQDFSEISDSSIESSKFLVKGFRKMYLAAVIVLLFAACMGATGTYSATAEPKLGKSKLHPTKDQLSWIASLMPVGALVGGTAGVMISKLSIFISVFAWMFIDTATPTSSEEDYFTYQYSNDDKPSFKHLLVQRVLDPNAFEDNLSKIREAGLKRAHARGLEKIPPGFVGVRGKKSEKAKAKDPFPGFVGVRGKKTSGREIFFPHCSNVMDDIMIPLAKYFQKDYFNFKGKKHH